MSLQSTVNAFVAAGNLTQQQGDELVAAGGGNLTAQVDKLFAAGSITDEQRAEIVAAGGGM